VVEGTRQPVLEEAGDHRDRQLTGAQVEPDEIVKLLLLDVVPGVPGHELVADDGQEVVEEGDEKAKQSKDSDQTQLGHVDDQIKSGETTCCDGWVPILFPCYDRINQNCGLSDTIQLFSVNFNFRPRHCDRLYFFL